MTDAKLLEQAQKIVDSKSVNEQMRMLADNGIEIAGLCLKLSKQLTERKEKKVKP
jgi:HD-like signal output (HDOD) protein